MRFHISIISALIAAQSSNAFAPSSLARVSQTTSLKAIGLGPGSEAEEETAIVKDDSDIVEPDHELFRESRLGKFDKKCDDWYGKILDSSKPSFLGKVSEEALRRINTLPKLAREVSSFKILTTFLFLEAVHFLTYYVGANSLS
jgi:hypothetical protein